MYIFLCFLYKYSQQELVKTHYIYNWVYKVIQLMNSLRKSLHIDFASYTLYIILKEQSQQFIYIQANANTLIYQQQEPLYMIYQGTITHKELKEKVNNFRLNNVIDLYSYIEQYINHMDQNRNNVIKLIEEHNQSESENNFNHLTLSIEYYQENNIKKQNLQGEEEENKNHYQEQLIIGELKIALREKNINQITFLKQIIKFSNRQIHQVRQTAYQYRQILQRKQILMEKKAEEQDLRLKGMMNDFLSQAMVKINRKLKIFALGHKNKNKKIMSNNGKSAQTYKINDQLRKKETQNDKIPAQIQIIDSQSENESHNSNINNNSTINNTNNQNVDDIRIPIQFDDKGSAYHQFAISNNKVTKIGGYDYQPMLIKYQLPSQGKHSCRIKIYKTKKSCLWFGIIQEDTKLLLHSSINRNYLIYRLNTCHIISNVENVESKHKQKTKPLTVGGQILLIINMDNFTVTWILSNGGQATAQIPIELRNMVLVPFIGIFTTEDSVEFQE